MIGEVLKLVFVGQIDIRTGSSRANGGRELEGGWFDSSRSGGRVRVALARRVALHHEEHVREPRLIGD